MLNRIIRFSLDHRLLVTCAAVLIFVYGLFVVRDQLNVDVFPHLNRPTVDIFTVVPGLSPQDVELQVTLPLEYALDGATNLHIIRSKSEVGLSLLTLQFAWGSDIYRDRQVVTERLQIARASLPAGVTPVMGPITSIMGEIMMVALQGPPGMSPLDLRSDADWIVRPRVLGVTGVSLVTVMGGGTKQYQVLASEPRLREYNISMTQLEAAVGASNQNTSGGFLLTPNREFMVRNLGRTTSLQDIGETVVAFRNNHPIRVKDLARLQFGQPPMRGSAGLNGRPAVMVDIYKQPNVNDLKLTRRVQEELESLKSALPPGVTLHSHVFRQADFIENAIGNVEEALWEGGLLVFVILFLFLWNFRTTIINIIAIPMSFLMTFLFMRFANMDINTMTLGGLAVAIGLIIDDAIVDVENVFRRLKENRLAGEPERPLDVIFKASSEIRNSIVSATFIIILVFLPLFFLSGLEGRLFPPLGEAFIVSLLASLIVSLTLTPVLCSYLLPRAGFMNKPEDAFLVRWLKKQQVKLLHFTLPHAWEVLIVAAFLVVLSIAFIPLMGTEFLPPFNEGNLTVNILADPGISLAEANRIGTLAEDRMLKVPGVISTGRRTGRAELDEHAEGIYYTEIAVRLNQSRPKDAIVGDIRKQLAILPGVSVVIGQPISHRLEHMQSGVNAQIAVKVFGPNLAVLRQKAAAIDNVMKQVPGLVDVATEKQMLVPQVRVKLDRHLASEYGLQVATVNQVLETALNGRVVSQILDGLRRYDLVVWLDKPFRNDVQAIGNILIDTPTGARIPLRQVASIQIVYSQNEIDHENLQRRIVVQANVAGRDLGGAVQDLEQQVKRQVELPAGYHVVYAGEFQNEEEATHMILLLSVFAIIGMFILLYSQFGFVRIPLQVMSNLPLALVGGVIAVFLTGGVLSVASTVGFIFVMGIAARNGIMMISHYIHLVQHEGEKFDEKMIFRGTLERLRPVLMTALAAILGVVPLALARGQAGKELLQPIAVVIIGGLISSTLLDWMVTPALFYKFGRPVCEHYLAGRSEAAPPLEANGNGEAKAAALTHP